MLVFADQLYICYLLVYYTLYNEQIKYDFNQSWLYLKVKTEKIKIQEILRTRKYTMLIHNIIIVSFIFYRFDECHKYTQADE